VTADIEVFAEPGQVSEKIEIFGRCVVRERGDRAVPDRWFRTEGGGLAGDQAHYRPVRTGEFIEGAFSFDEVVGAQQTADTLSSGDRGKA